MVHQLVPVDAVDQRLIVRHDGRAIRQSLGQIAARPVKDGHKVVADDMDAQLADDLKGADIVFDIPVPLGQPRLDGVVDVDALNPFQREPRRFDLLLERAQFAGLPDLAGELIVERGDHARHARDLADLCKRYRVKAAPEPTHGEFHRCFSPSCRTRDGCGMSDRHARRWTELPLQGYCNAMPQQAENGQPQKPLPVSSRPVKYCISFWGSLSIFRSSRKVSVQSSEPKKRSPHRTGVHMPARVRAAGCSS